MADEEVMLFFTAWSRIATPDWQVGVAERGSLSLLGKARLWHRADHGPPATFTVSFS